MCPRACNAQRTQTENVGGFCQMPATYHLARVALHQWEEPCISGTAGSGAVFFSGCNLRCVYCQNYDISTNNLGKAVTEAQLIEMFEALIEQGAANINLVNPNHYAFQLAQTLRRWKSPVPIVYNTNAYETIQTLRMLGGVVDVYLPDLKYCREDKAVRYSSAPNYFEVATRAILEMVRQTGANQFDEKGMLTKGVLVRHLILPANTNSSLTILEWLKANLPATNQISVMAQYLPLGKANSFTEINRKITKREYDKVQNHLLKLAMENGYLQERSSANNCFVPDFDFTGMNLT